jgi:hypothetical chaperone protein
MRIGIDFGTTHTSAAFYDGEQLHFIPLDPASPNPQLLRSMIYITREQEVFLGLAAVQRFLEQETGRTIVYEDKVVGTIENTVADQEGDAPITIIYDVTTQEDVSARGRLLQSIKTGLRSAEYRGTNLFGRYYSLEELIALLLRHVRLQASAYLGTEIRIATLGRPVFFAEDPVADAQAEGRLRQAALLAGFACVDFVPEPVAAAQFYHSAAGATETTLIFDFGGGTLDFTVMQTDGEGERTILATHGVSVGGDDLDSALMHHQIAPYFGAQAAIDTNYDGRPLLFPEDLAQLLDHWQTIPTLSRPEHLALIQRAQTYSAEREKFARLAALVTKNYGFPLFAQIEQAKQVLSSQEQAQVGLDAEGINLAVTVTRPQFHLAVGEELAQARQGARQAVRSAGLSARQIDVVVTTGGSSVIPLFQKMLAYEFPTARLMQADTFTSVVGGLAIYAAGLRQAQPPEPVAVP